MPTISDIIERLCASLREEQFTPALRVVSPVELAPPAAYPQLAVLAAGEDFGPGDADVTARLLLRLSCAGGRPADTAAQLRSLSHQLRRALARTHGLGGTVLRLRSGAIRYGLPPLQPATATEPTPPAEAGVVQRAEIELTLKYHEGEV
jgi:hypothetical protein